MDLQDPRRRQLRAIAFFASANLAVALLLSLRYLMVAGGGVLSPGSLFGALALVSQLSAVCLLIALALAGLTRLLPPRALIPTQLLGVLAYGALLFFLLVDGRIFSMFRFHFNSLALNVLETPGGWESIHVPARDVAMVGAGALVGLVAEYALVHWLATLPQTSLRRPWMALGLLALVAGVSDRVIYAVADLTSTTQITRQALVVPGYLPFTVKKIATRLGWKAPPETRISGGGAGSLLRYPRQPLRFGPPKATPDIVWMVLDGFRADQLGPEVTPSIAGLAERAQVFDQYRSGGNATRFGIFTMFYGLHGSYWQNVLGERRGPALFPRLEELGYKLSILSGSALTFPEFKSTVFVDVPPGDIHDDPPLPTTHQKDAALVDELDRFLGSLSPSDHFFSFLFFDSSHAPYDFEESTALFRPYSRGSVVDLGDPSKKTECFNGYRDALHYLDGQVARVLSLLEKHGRKNPWIIVTGDHGEEFGEHGYWGHNGAFTPEQTHVPLVMVIPGVPAAHHDRAAESQDLAPTLMEMLGVENPPEDYSLGHSLLGESRDPFLVSCGWDECAMLSSSGAMVFGTESYRSGIVMRDIDYRELPRAVPPPEATLAVMGQMSAFLR